MDSALTVAVEAIDRLKTTAASHGRAFFVEVMGRESGYLALMTALAGGAEAVVVPEAEVAPDAIAAEVRDAYARGKTHAIVVVAEGAANGAAALAAHFARDHAALGFEPRVTTLGHVQRGGPPTTFDRLLGTRLGAEATAQLALGASGVLVGWASGRPRVTPLAEVVSGRKALDRDLLGLARALAR